MLLVSGVTILIFVFISPITRWQLDALGLARTASRGSKRTSGTGEENKSKLYIVLRYKKKKKRKNLLRCSRTTRRTSKQMCCFIALRSRSTCQTLLPDLLPWRGVRSLGTNSNQVGSGPGLLVITRTEIFQYITPLCYSPLRALPLFPPNYCSRGVCCAAPRTQQWRWMKAEVFIMRAIRREKKKKVIY